ncbi:ActS/PrrB/RegB family redox-sensitive histidine kinase [Phenylobacterium sp.]|uniref:ActS/PrrB/RegB family redox-sensitive histidine kinase n=1 Tax=Phenylobacterium sp. TaxID=1871053 RepID=UPI0035B167DB
MAQAAAQEQADSKTLADLDRAGADAAQARPAWDMGMARRGRLRVRTLTASRWLVIMGEVVILAIARTALNLEAPYLLCFGLVGLAAWINLLTGVASPGQRLTSELEAAVQLGFDVIQIGGLVYLTGGAGNPFMVMLVAPVVLAAATQPLPVLAPLGALAIATALALAFFAWPQPWAPPPAGTMSLGFRLSAAAAAIVAVMLIASYVRQAAEDASRMALALDVTQAVLAREQRLSALGALAAAAAHELGTPLATISIVAKEMSREAPTQEVKEDAALLIAQAERCREILRRLAETPDAQDEVHERMSLLQFVHEVIEPHAASTEVRVEAIVTGAPGVKAPDIWRMPEVMHAMTSFVENAVDFATSEVLVTARFDAQAISVEVRDDGPGFAPEVLAKLGEPYVTTRPGAEGSRSGHVGMGLGFFISKTLLERTGAQVKFQNARPRGAVVSARWPRARIEVRQE